VHVAAGCMSAERARTGCSRSWWVAWARTYPGLRELLPWNQITRYLGWVPRLQPLWPARQQIQAASDSGQAEMTAHRPGGRRVPGPSPGGRCPRTPSQAERTRCPPRSWHQPCAHRGILPWPAGRAGHALAGAKRRPQNGPAHLTRSSAWANCPGTPQRTSSTAATLAEQWRK
jgi:hypothetical protein